MTKKKILIVDDEPFARETLRVLLLDLGYAIQLVASGPEALAAAKKIPPAEVPAVAVAEKQEVLVVLGEGVVVVVVVEGHRLLLTVLREIPAVHWYLLHPLEC